MNDKCGNDKSDKMTTDSYVPTISIPNGCLSQREVEQEAKEYAVSRELKWFTVRFFSPRTLSGDRTRYIFVDRSQYGIVIPNVIFFVLGHLVFFYSLQYSFAHKGAWIYAYWFGMFTSLGISVGVHRLWSHRAYSARLPLRIFLSICFTAVGQNDIYTWCRDHRLHHKFTETDADPHNSRRGGFFAHVGWLLTKKHPDVLIKGKTIDNSDLLRDPVVYYNRKFYIPLYIAFRVIVPGLIPLYLMNVPLFLVMLGTYAQYITNLHATWFVNSAAHIFGHRPYNHKIQPRENWAVALFGYNEGFHNYHHQFPWDWRIAEHGITWFDPGKWFISLCEKVGLAYNLKEASQKIIEDTRNRVAAQLQANLDSQFYVHDHPYFSPHYFTDNEGVPAEEENNNTNNNNNGSVATN